VWKSLPQKHFYEFGPYRIDVALTRVERAGEPVTLPPKAFDLLLLLARNAHRVMSKVELMEALWPNTFVEDANLTQHVYTLRKALGDRPDATPYIETVPRRGYRLAADVREVHVEGANAPEPAASSPLPVPQVFEAERKRATVLHCGLVNPGAIAESLGSVEMHRLSEQLQALGEREVARYDGVVTEKHPDGFVALFGAREVHEDDARRAVLAALDLDRRIRDLALPAPTDEDRVAIKSGIATGPLIINRVTDSQRVSYVAVGDALRAANLLQQLAAPGTIVINDATNRAVEKHVVTEPVGPIAGSDTFRVAGVPARVQPAGRTARAHATFIGRAREAALLDGLLTQAVAGQGQVVSIVGEPGMGKSRLGYETTRAMAARAEGATILEGRCVSFGSLVPYLPLIDLLRAHCEVTETDTAETIRAAVSRAASENGLQGDAARWLLLLIGVVDVATARETLSPEAIKARTFEALRLLFLKAAARQPLVILVEDVHWIDRTSEEFLTTLAGQLVASKILLMATHRPGYRPPWMDRSYVTQIPIAPLSAGDSARLLESVAGDRSFEAGVSSAILQRGEGNPFFLEELARTVLEHGDAASAIPETVQGVIMSRLDRLPEVPKRLLQTASVIGREVPLRVLSRVWEGSAAFAGDIVELCRHEFLYERQTADDVVYVFKHALTQDVAYDSLLARRRRDLHLSAARALEALHADRLDEIAATLAYHYARTDLIDQAVTWLTRAADRAARVYANAEAILHLDLAARRLQRLPEGTDRDRRMLEVALRHAYSLYFLGRFRESVDVLLPHAARVARLNDAALAASYAFWLGHMYSRLGDQRRASEHAHRAIENATRAGDRATLGKTHGLLALEGHWSGRPGDGIAHGKNAIDLLRGLADQQWWLGMAHFYLAINHLLTGEFDAALAEAGRANTVGAEIGDPRLQSYAGYTTGWIELSRGNAPAAVGACRESLQRAPDRVSRAYASLFLSFALLEVGEYQEAGQRLEDTVKELEGFGFPQWHSLAAILMGEARRRSRDFDEAARWTACGSEIARRANYRYAIELGDRTAARIATDRSAIGED
jgi:DNA-binding winged helix-turn-helix (wHTH) protein/tetratricopeptide (TPR) repeat protein